MLDTAALVVQNVPNGTEISAAIESAGARQVGVLCTAAAQCPTVIIAQYKSYTTLLCEPISTAALP